MEFSGSRSLFQPKINVSISVIILKCLKSKNFREYWKNYQIQQYPNNVKKHKISAIPAKRKKHRIFRPTTPLPPLTRSLLLPKLNKAKLLIPTDPRHVSIHKRPLPNLMTMSLHNSQRCLYTGSLSSYLERHKAIR